MPSGKRTLHLAPPKAEAFFRIFLEFIDSFFVHTHTPPTVEMYYIHVCWQTLITRFCSFIVRTLAFWMRIIGCFCDLFVVFLFFSLNLVGAPEGVVFFWPRTCDLTPPGCVRWQLGRGHSIRFAGNLTPWMGRVCIKPADRFSAAENCVQQHFGHQDWCKVLFLDWGCFYFSSPNNAMVPSEQNSKPIREWRLEWAKES